MNEIIRINHNGIDIEYDPTYGDIHIRKFTINGENVFNVLYKACSNKDSLQPYIDRICEAVLEFNDIHKEGRAINNIFEHINPLVRLSNPQLIYEFYMSIIKCIWDWETRNHKSFHKGTPYFWIAEYLLNGNIIDLGLNYLVQAYEEDKRLGNPYQPAYRTLSFIDFPQNAMLYKVKIYITEFQRLLVLYRNNTKNQLDYNQFKSKFLENHDSNIEKIKVFFSYSFIQIYEYLESAPKQLTENEIATPLALNYLFNFGFITENLLANKIIITYRPINNPRDVKFYYYIIQFCLNNQWITRPNDLNDFNNKYAEWYNDPAYEQLIQDMVDLKLNITVNASPMIMNIESALLQIVRYIRNTGGHEIVTHAIIAYNLKNFYEIVMQTLFLIIEKLY